MTVTQQRPLRGSRISSFYPVKNLPSLASLDSAFQLQEYISLLIRLDVHDVAAIVSLPGRGAGKEREKEREKEDEVVADEKDGKDGEGRKGEVAVDEACWIYEQLRRLAQDLSHPLITMLQQECTRASCPEMKAGEWLYLCVAHGNDGAMEQCCAIDYILHTVDSATALLNSPRTFPSRLSIPQTSHRHFSALARRLGRIFAHAYFHHREAFEQAEAESSLYARFLALTSQFELVPPEFLVIPQNPAHGGGDGDARDEVQPPRLLAAAVDPAGQGGRDRGGAREGAVPDPVWDRRGGVGGLAERAKSHSPPGLGSGSESPRKFGRNRTDTMVFSDVSAVVDDLAKGDEDPLAPGKGSNELEAPSPSASADAPEPPKPADAVSATPGLLALTAADLSTAEPDSPLLGSPPETAKPALPEAQKTTEEEGVPAPAEGPLASTDAQLAEQDPEPASAAAPVSDVVAAEADLPVPEAAKPEEKVQEDAVTDDSPAPDSSADPAPDTEVADEAAVSQPEAAAEAGPEADEELAAELEKHEAAAPDSAPASEAEGVSEDAAAPTSVPETSPAAADSDPVEEKPVAEEPDVAAEASVTDTDAVDIPTEASAPSESEPETAPDDSPSAAPESAPEDATPTEPLVAPSTEVEKEKEVEGTLSEGPEP